MSYFNAELGEAYQNAKIEQYERKTTPGRTICRCRWMRIFDIQWRQNDAGNVYYWAEVQDWLSCMEHGLGCSWPTWSDLMHYSSATDRGGYKIVIDKCDTCDCNKRPKNAIESEYILGGSMPPWERGYVNPKDLPKTVKFIMDSQQAGSNDGIKELMEAELVIAGKFDPPSDSEMESLCKGDISLNLV